MSSIVNEGSFMAAKISGAERAAARPAPWAALLGVDGSGKSSVLQRLEERADEMPYLGLRVFHRRPRLVYQPNHVPGSPISHYGKPAHGKLKSLAKVAAMILDWNLGYWRKINAQRAQGYLVIADRHSLLDMLADPRRYRYGGPPSWVRLALSLTPRPGMILMLDAPENVLLARKSELTPEQIHALRKKYLEVFHSWRGCYILDAAQPLDDVVSDILKLITERFDRQFVKSGA
jgi:thymidylate kinase